MTRLEAALLEMAALLDEFHLPHMLIGGLAVAQWGEPRAALDVDLSPRASASGHSRAGDRIRNDA